MPIAHHVSYNSTLNQDFSLGYYLATTRYHVTLGSFRSKTRPGLRHGCGEWRQLRMSDFDLALSRTFLGRESC